MVTAVNAKQNSIKEKSGYNPKYVGAMCALLFALILGRALNHAFFYIFAGVSLLVFVGSNISHCIPLLLFLLPFATILKQDADSISIFTILFFLVVVKMAIANRKIDAKLLLAALVFFVYSMLCSGLSQLTTAVTMVFGMLLLYYFKSENVPAPSIVTFYSSGIFLSSLLAIFREYLPIVNDFVAETTLRLGGNNLASRFSGLQGNPNYYTLDIIMVLSAIIVLMYRDKAQVQHTVWMIVLSVLGLMSVSKSFLLVWLILILFWFVLSIKRGAGRLVKFLFIVIIGAAVVYYVAYDSINVYLVRLFQDSSASIGDVTTGRTDIWLAYIKAIFNDLKILFFGNGINTLGSIERGAHNTYIELIFYLGVVGTVIMGCGIKVGLGRIITKKIMWVPVLTLLVRMMAIGIVTYDNFWFYLVILSLLAKHVAGIDPLKIEIGDGNAN